MSVYLNGNLFKKSSYRIRKKRFHHRNRIRTHQMSSNEHDQICPWICLFCENFLFEPVTLYCGHTFCIECIEDEELCLRCSKNVQGQIQSSIVYARQEHFSKNHFLQHLLERIPSLGNKFEISRQCSQARQYFRNENYQQALEIYSNLIQQIDNNNEHLLFYGRAKTYLALKQFNKALDDIEQVIILRPQWAKSYYCRSEILFEMNRLTPALLSSLQGLTLDPQDKTGKQIMARHLHAVLHEKESTDNQLITTTNCQLKEKLTTNCDKRSLCNSPSCSCALIDSQIFQIRDFECSICINLLWTPITTPCGHVFCRECLIRSVDNTQLQCPMCKSSLITFFPLLIQSHINQTELISKILQTYFPKEYDERRRLYIQENIHGATIPRDFLDSETFEIPIFVCVLTLPCCTCPLHVFEPRYRLMMRRTIETQSKTFGMCKYDEQTESFSDYGTLLFIRGLVYTQDGRSIVDTIGRQRFRVIERGSRDGYSTAQVQLLSDTSISDEEFQELFQLNRTTYNRVHTWFNQLDLYRRTVISRQLDGYPICDDLIQGSNDGTKWFWIVLNFLPIEPDLQYAALISQSYRARLQIINDAMDFLLQQQSI